MNTSDSPPADAVEAGADALDDALDRSRCMGGARDHQPCPVWTYGERGKNGDDDHVRWMEYAADRVLSAAHAAGTIRWESEYREAVALLREMVRVYRALATDDATAGAIKEHMPLINAESFLARTEGSAEA